jgi:hypothetical protein
MRTRSGRSICRWPGLLAAGGLLVSTVVGTVALSSGAASAAVMRRPLCTGTTTAPGVLSGTFRSGVRIEGVCAVNAGNAVIRGRLTLTKGSALVAAFARNDLTGRGKSKLTVLGGVTVYSGATLVLGCQAPEFSCIDDPNQDAPTLSSLPVIRGNLTGVNALGIIVHGATISGNVVETGGGGGLTCDVPTSGVFALFQAPVYSDLEDTAVHGDVMIGGVHSCWMGVIRDQVAGGVSITRNKLADPDAIEILSNRVAGNLSCSRNSNTWDSTDETENLYPRTPEPNTVSGMRSGQCVLASPATEGGPPGPGPF